MRNERGIFALRLQSFLLLLDICQALVMPNFQRRVSTTQMMSIIERPDTPLFCLNVCLHIRPQRRQEFLDCIRANQEGTLTTEPLAVTYIYGEDETRLDTWRFFEQYVGKEGFKAHTQTQHFAAWEAFASTDPFSAPPEVNFFVEDSASSICAGAAAVQEVLVEGDFSKLFCLAVQMHVKPQSRDAFLEALRTDQQGARTSEPLAISYLFGEDTEKPNVFHMFEAYCGGRDGFAQHLQTPHYQKWAEFKSASEPFMAPASVGYYETYLGVSG